MSVKSIKANASLAAAMTGLVLPTIMSTPVLADGLEEIIVTATRQAQGSQDVPLALTAVSGDELNKQGINSFGDLNRVAPSLFVQDSTNAGSTRFSLRGISTQDLNWDAQSPVAVYLDDVYQTALLGTSNQLFDVNRIEVLRGPQGTLFGKNSTGGAVSYYSAEPAFGDEGYFKARYSDGERAASLLESAINTQLIDKVLAIRISGEMQRLGDYVKDAYLNKDYGQSNIQALRVQTKWQVSEATTANLILSADQTKGDAQVFHGKYLPHVCDGLPNSNGAQFYLCDFTGTPLPSPAPNPDTVAHTNHDYTEEYWNQAVALHINHDMGWGNLTSISHYRRGKEALVTDADALPGDFLDIYTTSKSQQLGQEVRLATDNSKALSGVAGVYYQHDRLFAAESFNSTDLDPNPFAPVSSDYNDTSWTNIRTDTYALFGSLTYKITDELSVTGGLRRSDERKKHEGNFNIWFPGLPVAFARDFVFNQVLPENGDSDPTATIPGTPFAQKLNSKVTTWDLTVNYKLMPDVLLFARAAKGFRSGGFNGRNLLSPVVLDPFKPEFIKSYELGIKSEYLDHTLRVNATAYHYDYTDQQVVQFNPLPTITNAGKSKVDGIELEVRAAPTNALDVGVTASFTQAKYKDYETQKIDKDTGAQSGINYRGKYLVQAPRWTANLFAAYTFDVSDHYALRAGTTWTYRSRVFFDASNDPDLSSPSATLGNVRLELQPKAEKGMSLALYVDNLRNKHYPAYAFALNPVEQSFTFTHGRKIGAEIKHAW